MPGGQELRKGVCWLLVALWGRRGSWGFSVWDRSLSPAPTAEIARKFPSGLADWQ